MARHKEFDVDKALDKAMQLFWCKGYEATSVQDLVDHMGINRGSLYDTFGDKHALFVAALERYQTTGALDLMRFVEQSDSVKTAIRQFFEAIIDVSVGDPARRGCFVANATVELAARDPAIATRVQSVLGNTEAGFYQALREARLRGEIADHLDPRKLARFLFSTMLGMYVIARANPDRDVLQDVVDVALSTLD